MRFLGPMEWLGLSVGRAEELESCGKFSLKQIYGIIDLL